MGANMRPNTKNRKEENAICGVEGAELWFASAALLARLPQIDNHQLNVEVTVLLRRKKKQLLDTIHVHLVRERILAFRFVSVLRSLPRRRALNSSFAWQANEIGGRMSADWYEAKAPKTHITQGQRQQQHQN